MVRSRFIAPFIGIATLCACAVAPPADPAVTALPGPGKTLAQFQRDDLACRQAVAAARSSVELQPRYGVAYIQCMYARGESVPTAPAYAYGYPYYPQYGYHRGTPVQPY